MRFVFAAVGLAAPGRRHRDADRPGPAFVIIPVGPGDPVARVRLGRPPADTSLMKADDAKAKAQEASRTQKPLSARRPSAPIVAAVVVVVLYDLPGLPL